MVPLRLASSTRNQGSRLHFGVENIDHLVSRLIGLAWGEKTTTSEMRPPHSQLTA
jgi:hypothetical protein